MPAQYTDITILLDRSGSMETIKAAMESALDEFFVAHKAVPSTRVTLIQFDSHNPQEVVYSDRPVSDVPRMVLVPRHTTPLCDALCLAIDGAGQRLAQKAEAQRPDQVLFVIITDGMENASHQYTRADVTRRVQEQTDAYHWQFVYLGANQDAIQEAATFGIQADHAMSYSAGDNGVRGMSIGVVANTVAYAQQVSRGSRSKLQFNTMQRVASMAPDEPDELSAAKSSTQMPMPLVDSKTETTT